VWAYFRYKANFAVGLQIFFAVDLQSLFAVYCFLSG